MPTIFSHAVAGLALGAALRPAPHDPTASTERLPTRYWGLGAAAAMLPDADVLAFRLGIPYEHVLGHRGISHSLPFAAALAGLLTWVAFRDARWVDARGRLWLYLFLATASHGALDALTSGGHGIAFLAPFWNQRYFLPWQPIEVSPLGLRRFLSGRGLVVLASELRWVWLPSFLVAGVALLARGRRPS
jgi:inner membrane protein